MTPPSVWPALDEVKKIRDLLDVVERQFMFFLGNEGNMYVLNENAAWILLRYDGHGAHYFSVPDGASSYFNWPYPVVKVLASLDQNGYSHSLSDYDFSNMRKVCFEEIPLFLCGGYVSDVLHDMLRKTEEPVKSGD